MGGWEPTPSPSQEGNLGGWEPTPSPSQEGNLGGWGYLYICTIKCTSY
ncbi:MAG: hypothetical protein F6K48_19070 [Okeania sp. SIO3H1]|nr:hypothetical protein [Okeania sp. SIO3H1]